MLKVKQHNVSLVYSLAEKKLKYYLCMRVSYASGIGVNLPDLACANSCFILFSVDNRKSLSRAAKPTSLLLSICAVGTATEPRATGTTLPERAPQVCCHLYKYEKHFPKM